MAKKKKRSTNDVRAELRLINEARVHNIAMLRYWKLRADKKHTDKEVLKQQQIIDKAEKRINEIEEEERQAPIKIKALMGAIQTLKVRKDGVTNRFVIARLKKVRAAIREAT